MRRRPIETSAVARALRTIFHANASAAADENILVARDEAFALHPYLFALQQRLRDEGGPGTRVRVDALVQRAMAEAMEIWERVNPAEHTLDHRWLALDEVEAITKIDPELGALTEQALRQARADRSGEPEQGESPTTSREFFDAYDLAGRDLHHELLPGGERVDAREGQPGREHLPTEVAHAFDYYQRAQAAGWASVSLHRAEIAGAQLWIVYVTSEGDASYLEILDAEGTTLDGARLHAHQILAWDEFPGRVRLVAAFVNLEGFVSEEGLSEADERAAAGQPPSDWPGEVTLEGTLLYPVEQQLGRIDFGDQALSDDLQELAVAALDHLWELPLRYGTDGAQPVRLGARGAGVLSLGSFTRPTNGETYRVAAWRDIDDASFVLYYRDGPMGLHLAISQFDN